MPGLRRASTRSWPASSSSRPPSAPRSCCGGTIPPRCARPSPPPAAAPRRGWRRSTARAPAGHSRPPSRPRWRGCAGDPARPRPRQRRRLRQRPLRRLRDPDLRPHRHLLRPADALPALAALGARLRHRDHRPLPQLLPPLPAADRGRRLRPRPQPDDRADRPLRRPGGRRRADPRVSFATARAWALAGAVCGLVFAADQAAKAAVEAHLVPGEYEEVAGPLELTLSHNRGVAFGLAGGAGLKLVLFTAVALAVIGCLFARSPGRPGMWVAVGLLAGGALGNLADRVRAGAVTDFVAVGSWPPFNLADAAITLGVLSIVFIYMREGDG